MTYNEILTAMLARVPDKYDKREGSFFWVVLAPIAWAAAQCHYVITWATSLVYPDTATGEYLDLNTSAFGLDRKQATKARRNILATDTVGAALPLSVGDRFSQGGMAWAVIEQTTTGGIAEAETAGSGANLLTGALLPIGAVPGLGAVSLGEIILPGTDMEEDEALRARFAQAAREQPFGGNPADYRQRAMAIEGVGACAVFPVWNGDGTVKVLIGNEDGNAATTALVAQVQSYFGQTALGDGVAPVGHMVTVGTSTDLTVTVSAGIRMKSGSSFSMVTPLIIQAIQNYINSIPFEQATVFQAQAIVAALSVEGVVDVQMVKLNGSTGNLALSKTAASYQTPVAGAVTLTEVTA